MHHITHKTIKKVTEDIEKRFHFNTAISSIMELVNSAYQFNRKPAPGSVEARVLREAAEAVILLLSPFAPHICEELWAKLGSKAKVCRTPWPVVSADALTRDEVTVVVQVNGKMRSKVLVPAGSGEEAVRVLVMDDEKTREWTDGKSVKKFIYVPGKIVNVVVA